MSSFNNPIDATTTMRMSSLLNESERFIYEGDASETRHIDLREPDEIYETLYRDGGGPDETSVPSNIDQGVPREISEPRKDSGLSLRRKQLLIFFVVSFVVSSVGVVTFVAMYSTSYTDVKILKLQQTIDRRLDAVVVELKRLEDKIHSIQLTDQGFDKIIIATGSDGVSLSSVEVIDTSDRNVVCNDLPPYPKAIEGATGGLLGTTPVICGRDDTCYSLVNGNWQLVATMTVDRGYSASAVVGDSLLVMGGRTRLDTSDMVRLASSEPGPKLQSGVNNHCAVALNESTIMIIGGFFKLSTTDYYHLDIDHWIKGPDLNTGRHGHSCAAIKSNDQVTVVAAGGYHEDSVEVLTTRGASEWSYGTPLPVTIGGGQLVPDATGNGVFMIGGYDDTKRKELDTIYHKACVDCDWVKITQSLKTARANHVAIPVPDDLVTCQ